MIADISARFINLPRDRFGDGVRDGLARVARHAGAERARIALDGVDATGVKSSYQWQSPDLDATRAHADDADAIAARWSMHGYEQHGCIHVASVASLPESAEKNHLRERGIRSWLCVPLWLAGKRVGSLTLDTVSAERQWATDDIALLRTAGEIFANAIARERHETEREALEARLNQSQRLEALGTLAGGIAHEFNNILSAMLGYAELALMALRKASLPRRHVQQIMTAGGRAQGVIDQVLAFGRRSDRRYRSIEVRAVVAEAMDLLRASLPSTITLRPRLEEEGVLVLGDSTQLQQVIMNLCTNAAQAMDGRGTIDIGLDAIDVGGDLALSHGNLQAGRYARLVVRDTGHGIDATVIGRMFEPFFTTKSAGQGTGLGLPTVHGIVTQHGGAVNVQSQLGVGSTFEVYLPRTDEIAARDDAPVKGPMPRGHGQTILIVDDEKQLVLLGEEMLAALGYEAVGFDSSTAALAAFHADPQRFDLVLTDDVMPELTGTELAAAVHQVRSDLPIVLMTGHRTAVNSRRLDAVGVREVLKKPLLATTLAVPLARQFARRERVPSSARP